MIVIANVLPIFQTVKDLVKPLSKKRRFRTSFDSQQVKGSQILVKSAWDQVYHISLLVAGDMIWKTSPLVKFEILRVFFNRLTVGHKDPVQGCEKFSFPIELILLKKRKCFSQFQKRRSSELMYVWYYWQSKTWLDQSLKSSVQNFFWQSTS